MIGIDVKGFLDFVGKLGFTGLLAFVLLGFQQGWWVFGRERDALAEALTAMTADRNEWRARALAAMSTGERAAAVATTILPSREGAV